MKFSDKLPKLRKNNNITQEQLADMLGVSRQAVSKWESGLSIPDMEKIIEMCKIFNCQIEELLDDGVTSSHTIERNKTLKEYYESTLQFITKTYKMFCSMKFLEKLKCLFELCLIIGIQILLYLIIGTILGNLIGNIINFLPYQLYDFFADIGTFIYICLAFIVGTIITIHLFKARYLNYFVIVSDKFEKTTVEEREVLEKPKETIIIRDIKNNSSILKKSFTIFMKFCSTLIAIPLILSFLIFTFLIICIFVYLNNGLIFLGALICLLGILAINYSILELLYFFIFNLKQNYKKIFIIFIISIFFIGGGSAIVFTNYLTFIRIENNLTYKEATYNVDLYEDNILYIYGLDKNDIIIDNSLDDIEMTVEYIGNKPEVYPYESYLNDGSLDKYVYIDIYARDDVIFYLNLVLKDFKNKNLRNYDELENYRIKTIKISENNLNKIKY